ncbi:hypothetical protein CerSpe_176540 [Prunus speciosa]
MAKAFDRVEWPFLIAMMKELEGLTSLIKTFEERQALHGFQLRGDGISISHLLFADDSVLFCRADEREAKCVVNILQCYEAGSG